MRWWLLMLVGCYSPTPPAGAPCGAGDTCPSGLICSNGFCGGAPLDTDGRADADPDGMPPIPDACVTFASQLDTCVQNASDGLTLNGDHVYDTDAHELRTANGALVASTHVVVDTTTGRLDVLLVTDFTITNGNTLRVIGKDAFGIVSDGITINGVLDGSEGGAGARSRQACGTSAGSQGTTNSPAGSSGGGGGAMRGTGGTGGKGDGNGAPINGGTGGAAISMPTGVLGGCPGGRGGGGQTELGPSGDGGGAIYLVAAGTININGVINVGGSGAGHAHALGGGGGGGGSGGMIWIEAPSVNVNGTLAANGGGGSGGADDVDGAEGSDGESGHASMFRAKGGAGSAPSEGGAGGDGGAGNSVNGFASVELADNGGGGGGGGCGFITIHGDANTQSATISPSLTP